MARSQEWESQTVAWGGEPVSVSVARDKAIDRLVTIATTGTGQLAVWVTPLRKPGMTVFFFSHFLSPAPFSCASSALLLVFSLSLSLAFTSFSCFSSLLRSLTLGPQASRSPRRSLVPLSRK